MRGVAIQLVDNPQDGDIADLKIKKVLDSEGKIASGLVIGDTTQQNMAIILTSNPGEIKQYPTMGVGLIDATHGTDLLSYRHNIRSQFKRDKLKISELELYDPKKVSIKANY